MSDLLSEEGVTKMLEIKIDEHLLGINIDVLLQKAVEDMLENILAEYNFGDRIDSQIQKQLDIIKKSLSKFMIEDEYFDAWLKKRVVETFQNDHRATDAIEAKMDTKLNNNNNHQVKGAINDLIEDKIITTGTNSVISALQQSGSDQAFVEKYNRIKAQGIHILN